MRFYSLGLDELRQPKPRSAGALLGRHGEYLADVVGALARDHGGEKKRLDAYLAAVLGAAEPGDVRIEQSFSGSLDERGYTSVLLHSRTGVAGRDVVFGPTSMSDGTIRAAGVLAALFQPAAVDGRVPLVGIEEPETALHPAAAGVLFDALTEASQHVQVVATSQSADLLDREDLDLASVRSVTSAQSLAGRFDFPADMRAPDDPEAVRDAKGWLSKHRPGGRPYKETVDQASLASAFDIVQARKCSPSFDKFCRDLEALLNSARD